MFNITSGTVILLGGPVYVAATSDLSSTVTVTGAGFVQVGGGAALSASGTFQTATPARVRFASAEPMSGQSSVTVTVTLHIRAAASTLSSDLDLAAGGGFLRDGGASLDADTDLVAAGGGAFPVSADPMSATATMIGSGGFALTASAEPFTFTVDMIVSANPVYRLNLPTADQVLHDDYFFKRYMTPTGVSLVITGGSGRLVQYPSDGELNAADAYFLGGLRHEITPAERALIISAGFGHLLEEA